MEDVRHWWERRRFSRGVDVPYPVGAFREAWAPYPALARQFHPDLNDGIALSQIPPAADVLLCWQCDAGHLFAATPAEQRTRPPRERRRTGWCPECLELALPRRIPTPAGAPPVRRPRPARRLCAKTPDVPPGTAFRSECAPRPASRVEDRLRIGLASALDVDLTPNAVRIGRPFFDHAEVWPDLVLAELAVAVEYDTIGRTGSEHTGRREESDRRKDRLLRAAGWEVIRLRHAPLRPVGEWDLEVTSVGRATVERLVERIAEVRGELLVAALRRRGRGVSEGRAPR